MSMTGSKNSVLWSPTHDDKFITFTTDLSLYKVEACRDVTNTKTQGSVNAA